MDRLKNLQRNLTKTDHPPEPDPYHSQFITYLNNHSKIVLPVFALISLAMGWAFLLGQAHFFNSEPFEIGVTKVDVLIASSIGWGLLILVIVACLFMMAFGIHLLFIFFDWLIRLFDLLNNQLNKIQPSRTKKNYVPLYIRFLEIITPKNSLYMRDKAEISKISENIFITSGIVLSIVLYLGLGCRLLYNLGNYEAENYVNHSCKVSIYTHKETEKRTITCKINSDKNKFWVLDLEKYWAKKSKVIVINIDVNDYHVERHEVVSKFKLNYDQEAQQK